MGSKTDGFVCDHLKSKCCNAPVRFERTSYGYSLSVWCSRCGNYIYNGHIEGLIALWIGDFKAVIVNKGYVPGWLTKPISDLNLMTEKIKKEISK